MAVNILAWVSIAVYGGISAVCIMMFNRDGLGSNLFTTFYIPFAAVAATTGAISSFGLLYRKNWARRLWIGAALCVIAVVLLSGFLWASMAGSFIEGALVLIFITGFYGWFPLLGVWYLTRSDVSRAFISK